MELKHFRKISDLLWEVPKTFRADMRVPARIYATQEMLEHILHEKAAEQLVNMATLPGIDRYALAMPDIHQGYGFPIGGVAAIRLEDGIISPGGVGYDINCGVRLLASQMVHDDFKGHITKLANQIQRDVPSGVGRGSQLKLKDKELDRVLNQGAAWALKNNYALPEDLECIEAQGCLDHADAKAISQKAKERGKDQLGTLGAGNHFLEIQKVAEIFDEKIARQFNLFLNQIVILIHTGSRGLGHQVCTDYVKLMLKAQTKFKITLPDRELVFAPFQTDEGQRYFKAMAAAANFATVNRQMITDHIRNAWQHIIGGKRDDLKLIYDVSHNIAKLERHQGRRYIMHRKGATRAFSTHHPDLPKQYQATGQPVFIPGSMGTSSYVLTGTQKAMDETFGSICHGAGRQLSRVQAKKKINPHELITALENKDIVVRAGSLKKLSEEAPEAYKDIESVVDVVCRAGIANKIAKLVPLAIIKG